MDLWKSFSVTLVFGWLGIEILVLHIGGFGSDIQVICEKKLGFCGILIV